MNLGCCLLPQSFVVLANFRSALEANRSGIYMLLQSHWFVFKMLLLPQGHCQMRIA
jgi:hypothetical protein